MSNSQKKILVIDDNESITKLLASYLKIKKHECICTNNSITGLSLIQQQQFDVVLLDIAMPELSGLDLLEQLDKKNKIKENRIYLFTATPNHRSEIEKWQSRGLSGYLRKPIKLQDLMQIIESH